MAAIRVEVVDARRDGAVITKVELPAGALVRDALRACGIAAGMAADLSAVGVFGKRVAPDAPLADGDRVEIYRPLLLDPKERAKRKLMARR